MWRSKSHIESKYSISNTHIIHHDCWAIHQGHHKSTRKAVSIFKFDKSTLKQLTSNKLLQNQIITNLEKNVSNLTKLKHPNILTIIEPLEIFKNLFIFVTEPISDVVNASTLSSIPELIKLKGTYEITQALKFILESTGNVHLGINPNSILINDKGDWKLSNFTHLLAVSQLPVDNFINHIPIDRKFQNVLNLDLNFSSPEIILDSKIYGNSDIWSLGCLIYYAYSTGDLLIDCDDDLKDYQRALNHLGASTLNYKFNKSVPLELIPILTKMVTKSPVERATYLDDLIGSTVYQNNESLKFLLYLDTLNVANHEDLIQNFTRYEPILVTFPQEILIQKVLPVLLNIIDLNILDIKLINFKLIAIILSMSLSIGSKLSNLSFNDLIFDKIITNRDIFLKNEEIQLILLKNLPLFKSKLSPTNQYFNKFLTKLIEITLLPTTSLQIQFQSLNQIDIYLDSLDYSNIKNLLFVKICSIFNKTTSYQIKLTVLEVFIKLITSNDKSIDKFIIKESLFPLLSSVKFKDAKILIKILTIYEISIKLKFNSDSDEEYIVTEILPNIWKLSIENCLSLADYQTFVGVINELGEGLQKKRFKKLEQNDPAKSSATPTSSTFTNSTRSPNQDEEFGSFNSNSTSTSPKLSVPIIQNLSLNPANRSPVTTANSQIKNPVPQVSHQHIKPLTLQPSRPSSSQTTPNLHQTNSFNQQIPIQHQPSVQPQQPLRPQQQQQVRSQPSNHTFGSTGTTFNNNNTSLNTMRTQQQANVKLPPGFNDNLILTKTTNVTNFNDSTAFSSWDNEDSLI